MSGEVLLATDDGLIRVGGLVAPVRVASLGGAQKCVESCFGGQRAVCQVELRNGLRIAGTGDHCVLVAATYGLAWRRLDDVAVGDAVAVQVGSEMWAVMPPRFDDFTPTKSYGCQKTVHLPAEMTSELAFLLGAYAAEGHTNRRTWTVMITNACDNVLERVAAAWKSELGVEAKIVRQVGKCPGVVVASKTIVEFLEHLRAGDRASAKRIPDAVLRSPRPMVLAFLQGLALDAYVTVSTAPKWAICLDAPGLLDDLQAVLANLGILTGRVSKYNKDYDKFFDEVYVTGEYAQRVVELVPFLEVDKAGRAGDLSRRVFDASHATADVVAGIKPRELFDLLPKVARARFHYLTDKRTKCATRLSLERVAAVPGVVLPAWLQMVLDDRLHFSPVAGVVDAGVAPAFEVSVPEARAFIGNGIVNRSL